MSVVDESEDISNPHYFPAKNLKNLNLQQLLQRSDSLRSSGSGSGSITSESKRVSFNNDVKVKRIPVKSKLATTNNGNEVAAVTKVTREAVPPEEVEAETEAILKRLEGIECQVSNFPPKVPNALAATEPEDAKRKADNRLYGLHALNNLDIAVNGKEVNSMLSYQEIRKRDLSSSSNNVNNNSSDSTSSSLQPPASKIPAKPPRRTSPVNRGYMTHYATPAVIQSDLESVSSDLKYHRKRFGGLGQETAEDSAIASGGDADDSTVTSSYTSRFIRKSPPRQLVTNRMSPSRTCLTDTEILRSPSEVLYAVSDKYRHQNNELLTNTSSQTDNRPPPRYVSSSRPRSAYNYSSREDLASHDGHHEVASHHHGGGNYSRRSTSENHR